MWHSDHKDRPSWYLDREDIYVLLLSKCITAEQSKAYPSNIRATSLSSINLEWDEGMGHFI